MRAVALREESDEIPGRGVHKNHCAAMKPLTTSVSSGLSKDSDSILLKHTILSQEQHNNISLQTFYMLEPDLGLFLTDSTHFFPNDQQSHLL